MSWRRFSTTRRFVMAPSTSSSRGGSDAQKSLPMCLSSLCATSSRECSMTRKDYLGPDSRRIQQMFAGIAHRYDFLNHFLSISIDRRWRNVAVRKVRDLTHSVPPRLCLDLCSGTGDLALALQRGIGCQGVALDFCHSTLARAKAQ